MAKPPARTGVEQLLDREKGSATAVAAKLSRPGGPVCKRQLVEYWKRQGYVTGAWPLVVREVYGIPLYDLNPRIYPRERAA